MIDAIRVPVYDRDGQIILYDIFVGQIVYDIFVEGEWIGSRRTWAQCDEAITTAARRAV